MYSETDGEKGETGLLINNETRKPYLQLERNKKGQGDEYDCDQSFILSENEN